jgi:hypothetical protein
MEEDTEGGPVVCNGLNGTNGEYLLPPLPLAALSDLVQSADREQHDLLPLLRQRYERDEHGYLGPMEGVDATDLAEAGWGVIFPSTLPARELAALKAALRPLLALRKEQATRKQPSRYKEYTGDAGYRPGDSLLQWLPRHGMSPGDPADPDTIPYYLLIIGDPETIPYSFQYQLDVIYGVGRLYFAPVDGETATDTWSQYAQYAASVVAAETGQARLPRRVTLFGTANADDTATQRSARQLVAPLAAQLQAKYAAWDPMLISPLQATKERLGQLLGGVETPALLFTASHGMALEQDDPLLLRRQGALICQDWPGPVAGRGQGRIPERYYFSVDDVRDDAHLLGMIILHFACFGAGTPKFDDFSHLTGKPRQIAPAALVARLPQRLLSHPKGGALAVIGHVDRAWSYSFRWRQAQKQTGTFLSAMSRLLQGAPVGWATEWFNQRYAALATSLSHSLQHIRNGLIPDDADLVGIWTANNDARSYIVLGDPAVRLPAAAGSSHQSDS